MKSEQLFNEEDIVSTYTSLQAVEDGVLAHNPKKETFPEADK